MGIEDVTKDLGLELEGDRLVGAREAFRRFTYAEMSSEAPDRQLNIGRRLICSKVDGMTERSRGYTAFKNAWLDSGKSVFDYISTSSPWPKK